jgi:transcriptional regulator with XRE-family HTH domain
MIGMELRRIRNRMELTQAELGERLKVTGNSIARMERDEQAITPSMALLISYVVREAGLGESAHPPRSSKRAQSKRANAKAAKTAAR